MADSTCSIDGCSKPSRARGWCQMHYRRWSVHGDPHHTRPTAHQRFWAKVDRGPRWGCWMWTAGTNGVGYGQFYLDGDVLLSHRVSYEWHVGPIPDGLTLDHLCRTPACVNPWHLEPVTRGENVLRGEGPTARLARKTQCKRGHEFTPENTYVRPSGHRNCIACRDVYERSDA